ncbi:MAG: JAB domain-containing protein [Candidatus Moranbacteria bacterium]|nr:JAB domain-containing protein [Candidatus Moranbacteria bacterium]
MRKISTRERRFVFEQPVSEDEILSLAREITTSRLIRAGPHISSSQLAKDFLSQLIGNNDREVYAVIYLNLRRRIIAYEELFRGTINGTTVYPREIVIRVLFHNAVAVILAHNHPSGDPAPSSEDHLITKHVKEALALVQARLLDHLILAGSAWTSFADSGLL